MGIGDYIWPFERKFSQIPCARESAIAALIGGPCSGAMIIILTGKFKLAYKSSVYAGLGIFWIGFSYCRYQHAKYKQISQQFKENFDSGKIQ